MRIILNEIKKIFNLKTILILILGISILYKIFPSYYIKYFFDGQVSTDSYNIMQEMNFRYGEDLDENESKDFKTRFRNEKVKLADEYLSRHEKAKKLGVKSYNKLLEDKHNEKITGKDEEQSHFSNLYFDISFKENLKVFGELNAIDSLIETYGHKNSIFKMNIEEEFRARYNKIYNRDQPLINETVLFNYREYIGRVMLIIIVAIMFALGSIFIKDKSLGVDYIQYSSNIGRKINNKKIVAAVISSIMLTTIILGISLLIYFISNGTLEFLNTNINSVFSNEYVIDITYLQYIILAIIIVYILAISTGLITLFISNIGKSYIQVLSIGAPVCGVLIFISEKVVINDLLLLYCNQIIVIGLPIVLIVLGTIFIVKIIKGIKKRDILY